MPDRDALPSAGATPDPAPTERFLRRIRLRNVGPAPEMDMGLAPRFNLFTGDNGLGKTFLLDVIWWALTRTWPQQVNTRMVSSYLAEPRDRSKEASIEVTVEEPGRQVTVKATYTYRAEEENWVQSKRQKREQDTWVLDHSEGSMTVRPGEPFSPWTIHLNQGFATGLVVYAHADGSFSLWDPYRHGHDTSRGRRRKEPALVLTAEEVYNGAWKEGPGRRTYLCNGLISDWAAWSAAKNSDHERMMAVINALAENGPVEMGEPTRMSLSDSRDIPTLITKYAGPVPILHASAGVRRGASIAYMVSLARREHLLAAKRLGRTPRERIVLLLDEIESHLHPRWQRTILSSIPAAMEAADQIDLQVFVTTHSPLVMSAAEGFYDAKVDRWFDLVVEDEPASGGDAKLVELRTPYFERRGRVGSWLAGKDAFGLPTDRGNIEAEALVLQAREMCDGPTPELSAAEELGRSLARHLEVNDPFLARWEYFLNDVRRRDRAGQT